MKLLTEDTDRIYPVHQTSDQDNYLLKFRYYMTPIFVPHTDRFAEERNERYVGATSAEEWTEMLYQYYDYVFVIKTDEFFNTNYGNLFENNVIEEWTLYEIKKDDKNKDVLLIPVE